MYGEKVLNNHNILRYGLTIEFCEAFSSLKYLEIELPLVLIRHFHVFIKSYVDNNLENSNLINALQKKYKIYTMKDVQNTLARRPKLKSDLSKDKTRRHILMSGAFARFATEQFSKGKQRYQQN